MAAKWVSAIFALGFLENQNNMSGSGVSQTIASFLGQKREGESPNMDAAPKPPEGKAYFAEILIFFAVFLLGDVAEFGTIQLSC